MKLSLFLVEYEGSFWSKPKEADLKILKMCVATTNQAKNPPEITKIVKTICRTRTQGITNNQNDFVYVCHMYVHNYV